MKRKLIAVLALAALVVAGASAQLMIGVSGALPLDTKPDNYDQIANQFQSGQGIYYGGFIELGLGKIGFGVSANTMTIKEPNSGVLYDITDADLYAAFHILGTRSLLDPFAELGYGIIGSEAQHVDEWTDASYYWYVALGLGINLGPVGIDAKFSYNNAVSTPVPYRNIDDTAPAFGSFLVGSEGYLPPYRVTIAAKLIL